MQERPRLRLAWVNPGPAPAESDPPGADGARPTFSVVRPRAGVPERPIKLDLAIERHLGGHDGLSQSDFLLAFSGRATR